MASSFNNKLANIIVKSTSLKSVKSIKFVFNPWNENTKSIRDFFSHVYSSMIRNTNPKCAVTSDIRSDVCKPEIEVVFNDSTKAIFRTSNLTTYDITTEFIKLAKQKEAKENAASTS